MPQEKYVGVGGNWRRVIARYIGSGGAWRFVQESYVGLGGTWHTTFKRVFINSIEGDTYAYHVGPALYAQGWDATVPINWVLVVNAAVNVYSVGIGPGLAAINDSGIVWPVGSSGTIVNLGFIRGLGGAGGVGGNIATPTGGSGAPGSDCIDIHCPLAIDNTNGYILAGGGGGGGGAEVTVIT